jgi:tRNA G26 N,N-dimethylase Trm1
VDYGDGFPWTPSGGHCLAILHCDACGCDWSSVVHLRTPVDIRCPECGAFAMNAIGPIVPIAADHPLAADWLIEKAVERARAN